MARPHLLLVLLLAAALSTVVCRASAASRCAAPRDRGSTLSLLPVFSPCSPSQPSPNPSSFLDTLNTLSNRDASRLIYLNSAGGNRRHSVPVASGRSILQSSTYIARASLGTPLQPLLVAIDISSDASWFPSSAFSPTKSSTFLALPCTSPLCSQVLSTPISSCTSCAFNLTYASSSLSATLSQDSLSLATDSINSFTFATVATSPASSNSNSIPPQGLLGLGRGSLSLLSQTKPLYASTFSYCFPSFRSPNFSGSLRLGPMNQPKRIRTTPLLSNPHRPSLYYVNMTGIRVGSRRVSIPPPALGFDPKTGAGTIFDSGTMFTRLVAPAYTAVRDEFRRRVANSTTTVGSLGGFDTCFNGPVTVPTITFEFDGGLSVTLPEENVMIHSSSGGLSCLAMAAAPENVNAVVNVIASMQQVNHRVLFDVPNARVGVSRERCTM